MTIDITRKDLHLARERFASLLKSSSTRESDYQKLFHDCPFILSTSLGLALDPTDILPLGRPGCSEPDFIFFPHRGSAVPFYGVIELKRPNSKIVTMPRKGVLTLSRTAATAISQGRSYVGKLGRTIVSRPSTNFFIGTSALVFVIMGLTEQLCKNIFSEVKEQQFKELLPPDCRIIPYDELLRTFEQNVSCKFMFLVPCSWLESPKQRIVLIDDTNNLYRSIVYQFQQYCAGRNLELEVFTSDEEVEHEATVAKSHPPLGFIINVTAPYRAMGLGAVRLLRSYPRTKSALIALCSLDITHTLDEMTGYPTERLKSFDKITEYRYNKPLDYSDVFDFLLEQM